jgi:exodeoxyribonuclease V alpha subunit
MEIAKMETRQKDVGIDRKLPTKSIKVTNSKIVSAKHDQLAKSNLVKATAASKKDLPKQAPESGSRSSSEQEVMKKNKKVSTKRKKIIKKSSSSDEIPVKNTKKYSKLTTVKKKTTQSSSEEVIAKKKKKIKKNVSVELPKKNRTLVKMTKKVPAKSRSSSEEPTRNKKKKVSAKSRSSFEEPIKIKKKKVPTRPRSSSEESIKTKKMKDLAKYKSSSEEVSIKKYKSTAKKEKIVDDKTATRKQKMFKVEIIGKIKVKGNDDIEVEQNDGTCVTVITPKPLYYSVQGDLISCWCISKTSATQSSKAILLDEGEEQRLTMCGLPLITIEKGNKDTIIRTLIRIVTTKNAEGQTRMSIPTIPLLKFYDHIQKNFIGASMGGGAKCTSVDEYLSYKAGQLQTGEYKMCVRSILLDFKDLTYKQVVDILRGWYLKHDMRLIMVMGVQNTDKDRHIDNSYMTAGNMYERMTINPLNIWSIPFDQAIEISEAFGIQQTNESLAVGKLLRQVAKRTVLNGNTCTDTARFFSSLVMTNKQFDLLTDGDGVNLGPCVVSESMLYIREVLDIEEGVAKHIGTLLSSAQLPTPQDMSLLKVPDENGFLPDAEQARAIEMACTKNISIITGAAGTGKTTIIKKVTSILTANKMPFMCTSFTGKATDRIDECCDVPVATADMLIVERDEHIFTTLIWDESSMTSLRLLWRLLNAYPNKYRIVLIGDPYQLEPIEWGSVLSELIASSTIPLVRLTHIYRVITEEGMFDRIVENSKRMAYWKDKSFDFVQGDNFEVREGDMRTLIQEIKRKHAAGVPASNFVIISPFKEYLAIINRAVQYIYNKNNPYVRKLKQGWIYSSHLKSDKNAMEEQKTFHVGDRVMMTANNKQLGVSNGQEGIIKSVSLAEGIMVAFRKKDILFPLSGMRRKPLQTDGDDIKLKQLADSDALTLNFAVTVHKAQGSQWKEVYYYSHKWTPFITRNMIYTATTRAMCRVLIIGLPSDATRSVENVPHRRTELLCLRLRKYLPMDYVVIEEDEMAKELALRRKFLAEQHEKTYGNAFDDAGDDSGGYYPGFTESGDEESNNSEESGNSGISEDNVPVNSKQGV